MIPGEWIPRNLNGKIPISFVLSPVSDMACIYTLLNSLLCHLDSLSVNFHSSPFFFYNFNSSLSPESSDSQVEAHPSFYFLPSIQTPSSWLASRTLISQLILLPRIPAPRILRVLSLPGTVLPPASPSPLAATPSRSPPPAAPSVMPLNLCTT